MLTIDGSLGEGGGQVLRTCLALSLITGTAFRMEKIRAGRRRPGLLRQHLTAVQAARDVCGGEVSGDVIGSSELTFQPGPLRSGDYAFAVGTAGSACLVVQTVLPALMRLPQPSTLRVEGGTHNPAAPPFDYLERVFFPMLGRLGFGARGELVRHGFYPAGGGVCTVSIAPPGELRPLSLTSRGAIRERRAECLLSRIPFAVAERELQTLLGTLGWSSNEGHPVMVKTSPGPGNVLSAEIEAEQIRERFSAFGVKGLPAEQVAQNLAAEVSSYLASDAPVGPHLADQLLLPLALAKGGELVTTAPLTGHTLTQAETIARFLEARISLGEPRNGMVHMEVRV